MQRLAFQSNKPPFVVSRLSDFVDVGAVTDAVDVQSVLFDIEGEEDPIVTAPCCAQSE